MAGEVLYYMRIEYYARTSREEPTTDGSAENTAGESDFL